MGKGGSMVELAKIEGIEELPSEQASPKVDQGKETAGSYSWV